MSDKEKQDATVIAEAYAQMTDEQKQYFIGYAQATVDAQRRKAEKEAQHEETENN